jgi:glycosyltransferase involved in cell wall biosynthesis
MRIVHVADYFQPELGYQEYYLAAAQAAAGHDVHVVTSDRYLPFPNYSQTVESLLGPRRVGAGVSKIEGMTVHRLPCAFEYRRNAIWLRDLEDTLARIAPDVVSVDGVFAVTSARIARMNRRLQLPLVFDNHAAEYNTALKPSLRHQLTRYLFRRWGVPVLRREADVLIAIDEGTRAMLVREMNVPAERIPVIELGADTRTFWPDPAARAAWRTRLNLDAQVVVTFTGKLHPGKGAHVLLQAAAELARELDSLRVVIIGNGPEEYVARLDEMARWPALQGRVIFIRKFLDREGLNEVLNGSDVGVWPGEPSNVIQEAIATGLPIVLPATNLQGLPNDAYVRNQNGLLYERGHVEGLVAALRTLGSDAELRRKMSLRARDLVERELGWAAIATRFVAEFQRAIGVRKARHEGVAGPYATGVGQSNGVYSFQR